MAIGIAKHIHRWMIGQPDGKPKLKGQCRGCGKTRRFQASVSANEIHFNPRYKDMLKSGGAW